MKQPKRAKSKIAVRAKPRLPRSKLSVVERAEVFERFSKQRPNPKGELDYSNTYTLLVAVLLSAQATDVGVNKATRHLFQIADTPEKMVALGEENLRDQVRTIGLYKTKAKNTIAMSKMLIDLHGSEVPNDQQALEALPGVGRKTANVVRNIAFGEPTIAVDTHIFRIGNRVGLAPGKDVVVVENNLARIIPAKFMMHAHHWLILHGRYICKARTPDCGACIIADLCKFREKTNDLPAPIVELAEYVSR